jgi:Ca2+-binding RTX toxin-like protein
LDYSGRLTGVTVDLTSGTATGTGGISDIESVIGGAGDDTLIGALNAVLVDTGAGADTLDFSNVSASLTMALAANGTLTVTDGINTVSGIRGVETVTGGLGDDTLVGPDTGGTWALTGPNTGMLSGLSFSRIETLQGGTGADTLFGPAIDTNWNITASDEGEVAGV